MKKKEHKEYKFFGKSACSSMGKLRDDNHTVYLAASRRREELSALVTKKGTVFLQVLKLEPGFELVLILTGVGYTSVDVANDAILE